MVRANARKMCHMAFIDFYIFYRIFLSNFESSTPRPWYIPYHAQLFQMVINILQMVRAGTKILNKTFIDIDISHRIESLQKSHCVTLT